jgi:hypothetical protein
MIKPSTNSTNLKGGKLSRLSSLLAQQCGELFLITTPEVTEVSQELLALFNGLDTP